MNAGRLRIFLGMCPGVGKTYAMLLAAQQRQEDGADVAIGWIETHGRIETTALSAGLRRIPPRRIEHRGVFLEEMDLDAILERKPDLVLVDELAHTNAPGARHPKRYQDVLEILAAGISVYSTLNVQHLESVRDAVAGITGVTIRETLPDSVLDRASEVELVDITPEQLLVRLAEGKVYTGDRAASAAAAFFREGNLRALREIALRFVADRADREVRTYLKENAISGPWRSRERLMVAVGGSPHAERLIRITCRLAGMLDATWIAIHVDSGQIDEDATRSRTSSNLAMARSLGAETLSVSGIDAVDVLLAAARRENVTQIIAGKAAGQSVWQRLIGGSIADRLARRSGSIDVLLVHPGDNISYAKKPRRPRGDWQQWLVAAALLIGISTIAVPLEPLMGYRAVTMLYLAVIAFSGLFLRRWPVIALAVGCALSWNFFFTEPRLSLRMWNLEDMLLLATFLIVAVVTGHQTSRLLQRERSSRESEERARTLYELTRVLAESIDLRASLDRALKQVQKSFDSDATVLLGDRTLQRASGFHPTDKELSVCQWSLERGEAAGRFTNTLPEAPVLAIPLSSGKTKLGVLGLRPANDKLANPLCRDLLDAFAAHFVALIERDEMIRTNREAGVQSASLRLQRALIDDVSHELKTPVAAITTAIERLRTEVTGGGSGELVQELALAAKRLDRIMSQLVTLSRIQSGLIAPQIEVVDARDLLEEIVADFSEQASRLRIECGGFTFSTDASLLHTALANLVRNALQYSPPDSPVTLRGIADRTGVTFCIDDRGAGIPAHREEKVFEKFERGPDVTSGGMGLGLSIAKQFVEALGGRVSGKNRDGGGATFCIRLPGKQA